MVCNISSKKTDSQTILLCDYNDWFDSLLCFFEANKPIQPPHKHSQCLDSRECVMYCRVSDYLWFGFHSPLIKWRI